MGVCDSSLMTEWTQTINPSRAQDLKSLETLVGLWDKSAEEEGGTSAPASYSCELSYQHKNVQTQRA